jgi:hypothetical protein
MLFPKLLNCMLGRPSDSSFGKCHCLWHIHERGLYVWNIFCSGHQIIRKHHQKPWMQLAIENVFLQ